MLIIYNIDEIRKEIIKYLEPVNNYKIIRVLQF